MVVLKLIQYYFNRTLRFAYWLINLSKIKAINQCKIQFPIIVEGKGKIEFGSGTKVNKYASLLIARNASFVIGRNSKLDRNCDIRIGKDGTLVTGDNLVIEMNTRIFLSSQWSFGSNVKIATNCAIFPRESDCLGKLTVGSGSHIGDNTIIDVADDINIGENVAIGPNCTIYTHDHNYSNKETAAWKGGVIKNNISIAEGAWIGTGVTILPGVKIGKNCVIAAGSVVTKSIPEYTIWGGVPAKQLKVIE